MSRKMKSRPSIYACGCLDKVQKALELRNTGISTCLTMNFGTGEQGEALMLEVKKINPRGPKACKVETNFCPWCGVSYRATKESQSK